MQIIDAFSFNGELDLLEIRLNILNDYVDTFIVCESDETFTGISKPMYYEENKQRFKEFWPKIKHFKMSKPTAELLAQAKASPGVPPNLHWWTREFCQKESIKYAFEDLNLKGDDLIFIGDADEIWNPEILSRVNNMRWKLEQTVYSYFLNNKSNEGHWGHQTKWLGTLVAPYSILKTDTLDNLRSFDFHRLHMLPETMPNGGWHFTNMHGTNVDKIREKLNSYSHQEFNNEYYLSKLEQNLSENKDFLGRNFTFTKDESGLPEYILENKEKFAHIWMM